MILLNKKLYLIIINIIVLILIIVIYKRRKLFKTNIYSDGKTCPVCKGKNLKIKKKYFFTNKTVRTIYDKISDIKAPDDFPVFLVFIFMFPIFLWWLFKMMFLFYGLIVNYLLMLILPKKCKEHKILCFCRECGKVSVIQEQ